VLRSASINAQTLGDSIERNAAGFVTGTNRQILLYQILPSSGSFQVWATHGSEYDPVLPEPSVASGQASTQDVFPNGITWSKGDEPEHFMVPPGSVWLVGKQQSPVLRVLGTKDALWILKGKGDGIYRLNGFGEKSGWRVDPWDSDTYLIHPELAVLHGDTLYAWTNQGAVKIDDAGVTPIGAAINDQTRVLQQLLDHSLQPYAFAVSNFKDDSIVFGLPPSSIITTGHPVTDVFVYRTPSRAWVKWFVGKTTTTTGAYDTSTRLLSFGRSDSGTPRLERDPGSDVVLFADDETAITISAITGTTITFSGSWTPAVGDLVIRNTTYAIVTATVDATHCTLHTAVTTGGATAYQAYTSRLSWLPKAGGTSASSKRYVAQHTHWDDTVGVYGWATVMGASQNPGVEVSVADTRTYQRAVQTRADTRALVPRDMAMASQLYPSVTVGQADSRWRITGLTIDAEAVSARVGK
jgi:hypothetical protein